MFTEKNLQQIESHGLSKEEINRQLLIFKNGIPYANVVEAAAADNGIQILSEMEQQEFAALFENRKKHLDLLKFVPASGAATRMFKFLHRFLGEFNPDNDTIDEFLEKDGNRNLKTFLNSLESFAFSDLVYDKLKKDVPDFKNLSKGEKNILFVKEMFDEKGLDFSNTPKGLVPFHKYGEEYKTAFDEQLYEAAFYTSPNELANLHFTVSDAHESKFKQRFEEVKDSLEKKTGIRFNISYSFQKKETDTIAATLENETFFDENGELVFRPSGHGALLENLNEVDADIIFIKNIDNVVSKNHVETIAFHKNVLAGKLISLQEKIFSFIKQLHTENPSAEILKNTSEFISKELKIRNISEDKTSLLKILERPIRVCGVVANTGAPGGGPFLIKDKDGNDSYQIVEMSQIDLNNPQQKNMVDKATHFNPVDLACGVRDYKGEKFNLLQFSDTESGFISEKSYQGKTIKALERPGLWNGAMANWNTVFVEVPLITFNPVKTVNDLLNHAHQPK